MIHVQIFIYMGKDATDERKYDIEIQMLTGKDEDE